MNAVRSAGPLWKFHRLHADWWVLRSDKHVFHAFGGTSCLALPRLIGRMMGALVRDYGPGMAVLQAQPGNS